MVLSIVAILPASAISLDEAMKAALQKDSSLADARSKLKIAEANLFKSSSLYNSDLSLSGSVKDQSVSGSSSSDSAVIKSVAASLAVPLSPWIALGAEAATDTATNSGSVSVTLTPFAKADTQAKVAWNKAVVDAQYAVRSTILAVRREYRAVLTSRAEYLYRAAAVQTARNELSRIQYLVELGNLRKAQELTAYSDLMEALGYLDTAESNRALALQKLSLRTGLDESALSDFQVLEIADNRKLVTEADWVAGSADMAIAGINRDAALHDRDKTKAFPELTLGSNVDDQRNWAVTAKVSFSPDTVFQKSKEVVSETAVIQQRAYETAEAGVRSDWRNQQAVLIKAGRNYESAGRFRESAQITYTETRLLLDRGEASRSTLDSANENLLSAEYELGKALESLENARDQLDAAWQVVK